MKFATTVRLFAAAAVASLLLAPAAQADSGFFIGGAIGDTSLEIDDFDFDKSDSSYKIMFGYIFDMPVVDFGIEAAYNDLGAPRDTVPVIGDVEIDVTALSAFGTVGLDFGLFGFFAKAGLVSWDADFDSVALGSDSDSGTDPAYGIGARLTFSSIEVRAEYERFDVEDTDTVDMVSLGVIWRF